MLSVIVPVYNCSKYVEKCILSICNQKYQDIEVLCIDDGSTDGSGQILDELAKLDLRIKVIHNINSGVSKARNCGLNLAKGDYITFVDSDDELDPNMYSILMENITNDNIDIIHCGYKKIYSDGRIKDIAGTGMLIEQSSEEAIACLLTGKYFAGGIWNKIYAKSCISGLFFAEDLKINEDILFNFGAFFKAKKITFYDLPLYYYYERPGSACFSTNELKKIHDCSIVAFRIWKESIDEPYSAEAAYRYYTSLVNEYRTILFLEKNDMRLIELREKIEQISGYTSRIPFKYKLNKILMVNFPWLYLRLYYLYNKIRKPNWDIKE